MLFVLQGDTEAAAKDIETKAREAFDFDYNEVHIDQPFQHAYNFLNKLSIINRYPIIQ